MGVKDRGRHTLLKHEPGPHAPASSHPGALWRCIVVVWSWQRRRRGGTGLPGLLLLLTTHLLGSPLPWEELRRRDRWNSPNSLSLSVSPHTHGRLDEEGHAPSQRRHRGPTCACVGPPRCPRSSARFLQVLQFPPTTKNLSSVHPLPSPERQMEISCKADEWTAPLDLVRSRDKPIITRVIKTSRPPPTDRKRLCTGLLYKAITSSVVLETRHMAVCRMSDAAKLVELISRMQKCADRVEKDILAAEDLLAKDQDREAQSLAFLHQNECADKLAEAEGLLKDLFMDVDRAKKLGHPQVKEIERDVKNLHDRWANDCAVYRDVYDQVQDLDTKPKIDWASLLDSKLRQLESQEFGPSLSDVEKQMAAHTILHQEIEAYNAQLKPDSTLPQEKYAALKNKYDKLYTSSEQRRAHLSSLRDYMQSCNKELLYLSSQQDRIMQRDWSDRMADPAGVRTEYEKFKTNALQAHEVEINQLQVDGDHLVDTGHPASQNIRECQSTMQTEWQRFLNLCLAQEEHLDNIRDYRKFQLDADTLSDSLHRLHSNLDPKVLKDKSNQEVVLAIEGDEPALQRNEQRLSALRDLSRAVVPLKQRRSSPSSITPVVSLCNWEVPEGSVTRGQELILKSNTDMKLWDVKDEKGRVLKLPRPASWCRPPTKRPSAEWTGTPLLSPQTQQDLFEFSQCSVFPSSCLKPKCPHCHIKPACVFVCSLQRELSELKERRAKLLSSLKTPIVENVVPQKAATISSAPEDPKARELAHELDRIKDTLERIHKDVLRRLRESLDNRSPVEDLAKRIEEHETAVRALDKLESEKAALQREMQPIISQKPLGPTTSTLPVKLSDVNNKIDDITALMDLYKKKASASLYLEKHMQKVDGIVSGFEEQLAKDGTILDKPSELPNRSQQLQQSLDFFLINLPNNTIKPTDDASQISAKLYSQTRAVEDIKKKSADLNRVQDLSRDLQNLLNTYEAKSNTYRETLYGPDEEDEEEDDIAEVLSLTKRKPSTMAQAVQKQEKDLLNLYSEVSAKNNQLLKQLNTTKNIKARNDDMVYHVEVIQQQQLQTQQKDLEASDSLKKDLTEEIGRRVRAETDLETYTKRFMSLKSRRGVERVEEKEVVQYYRDPKLEVELESLRKRIQDEVLRRTKTHTEIEIMNQRMTKLQLELSRTEPKLITKVLTDPVPAEPKIREKVVKKEVVRLEKDPEMLKSVLNFKNDLADEEARCQIINESIFSVRSEINTLERIIPPSSQR
ncbi:hypothetical protein WMY93_002376 [Mugilogobius chulae]|uniref:Desmoplakin SH3 domain-containing protein n=1 Tax=Mugilogobius chulae TaxID=88201 RepID=A0AAW0Q1X9_9GOBI